VIKLEASIYPESVTFRAAPVDAAIVGNALVDAMDIGSPVVDTAAVGAALESSIVCTRLPEVSVTNCLCVKIFVIDTPSQVP